MAPASTGKDNNNKIAVTKTAHTIKGILFNHIPGARIFKIVVIKLMAPKIEDAPAKCKLKIAKSTEQPLWACTLDNGGYTVHPVPAPASTNDDDISNNNDGGNNQNDMLFNRGVH